MIRVMIVDDSAVARRLLARILGRDPEIEVVAEAFDGSHAVRLVSRVLPDVVTMDVNMPDMDGFEATRLIMERSPRPIVVVSASYRHDEVKGSFRALEAGALTVLGRPGVDDGVEFEVQAAAIVDAVKAVAGTKVVTRRPPRHPRLESPRPVAGTPARLSSAKVELVAIAASTGGPAALAMIFEQLPADAPVPIVAVQHIGAGFDRGLVAWLDRVTDLHVRLAADGMELRPGEVVIAPHDRHLLISRTRKVRLSKEPQVGGHRPSATLLFRSVAESCGAGGLAVILTGIGRDGADGLMELKRAGGAVIAQDEATSVVYGMPRAAALLGLADSILPVQHIADELVEAWSGRTAPIPDAMPAQPTVIGPQAGL